MHGNTSQSQQKYTVAIDMGGTNTSISLLSAQNQVVHKTFVDTEARAIDSVRSAFLALLKKPGCPATRSDIGAFKIGTTKFINALKQRDVEPVMHVRISLPSCSITPPFTGCDKSEGSLIRHAVGSYAQINGEIFLGGSQHGALYQSDIEAVAEEIIQKGLKIVSVACMNATDNPALEIKFIEELKKILAAKNYPLSGFSLSHSFPVTGLLHRENTTALNAALLSNARDWMEGLSQLKKKLFGEEHDLPFFMISSDGSCLPLEAAIRSPILMCGSGPINSLRGAQHLMQDQKITNAIVVDTGGTTCDVGRLKGGMPLMSNVSTNVDGVSINIEYPLQVSLAQAGGTIVTPDSNSDGNVTITKKSVERRWRKESRLLGGSHLTLTDIAVVAGHHHLSDLSASDQAKVAANTQIIKTEIGEHKIHEIYAQFLREHAALIVSTLNCDEQLPIIFIGGFASAYANHPEFLNALEAQLGYRPKIYLPENADVANAIGAGHGVIRKTVTHAYTVEADPDATETTPEQLFEDGLAACKQYIFETEAAEQPTQAAYNSAIARAKADAIAQVQASGGVDISAQLIYEGFLSYDSEGRRTVTVVAEGSFDYDQYLQTSAHPEATETPAPEAGPATNPESTVDYREKNDDQHREIKMIDFTFLSQTPITHAAPPADELPLDPSKETLLTPEMLEQHRYGGGILGAGGGGSIHTSTKTLEDILESGAKIRITRVASLADLSGEDAENAYIIPVGMSGTPEGAKESLRSPEEFIAVVNAIIQDLKQINPNIKIAGVMPIEAAGLNLSIAMMVAYVTGYRLFTCDLMGRAFPKITNTTLKIYGKPDLSTFTLAGACGATEKLFNTADPNNSVSPDVKFRSTLRKFGGIVAVAAFPMNIVQARHWTMLDTVDVSLQIGALLQGSPYKGAARLKSFTHAEAIAGYDVNYSQPVSGRIAKIHHIFKPGFNAGFVIIIPAFASEKFLTVDHQSTTIELRCLLVYFQNENLLMIGIKPDGSEIVLAASPNIINLFDSNTGYAMSTEEYSAGQLVTTHCIEAPERLRTEAALEELIQPELKDRALPVIRLAPPTTYRQKQTVFQEGPASLQGDAAASGEAPDPNLERPPKRARTDPRA